MANVAVKILLLHFELDNWRKRSQV